MTSKLNKNYTLINRIECKQGAVRAVRFNVDGGYCLTCGSDKSLKLWNPYKGTLLHTYSGHGFEVLDAKGSSDNSLLGSCGLDKSVMLWNVTTGQCLRKLRGHAARVNCLSFNEESTVIISGSVDNSVRIWDMRSRKQDPIQILDDAKDSVMSVCISAHEILTGSLDCYTRLYDIRNGRLTSNCIGESITGCSFSDDSQCILVSTINSGLVLMDKDSGELLSQYDGHKTSDIKIESCFNAGDNRIFSGSEEPNVYCWDLISTKILYKLDHKLSDLVHSLSPHPDEEMLLSATRGQIWLWGAQEDEDGL